MARGDTKAYQARPVARKRGRSDGVVPVEPHTEAAPLHPLRARRSSGRRGRRGRLCRQRAVPCAAGAVEAIFSVLAIRDNVAPPTLNLDNPSVATPIDLVPHQPRKKPIDTVLSNSFGFGGTNASLILRRFAA